MTEIYTTIKSGKIQRGNKDMKCTEIRYTESNRNRKKLPVTTLTMTGKVL